MVGGNEDVSQLINKSDEFQLLYRKALRQQTSWTKECEVSGKVIQDQLGEKLTIQLKGY